MTGAQHKHLLIVEDSPDLQILLTKLLKSEGYSLTQAYNGLQALELLKKMPTPPAAIILDIMMPVMDGIEFLKTQKKDPQIASIPVIVMTADTNAQATVEAIGVTEYIRKPIMNIDRFLESVRKSTTP